MHRSRRLVSSCCLIVAVLFFMPVFAPARAAGAKTSSIPTSNQAQQQQWPKVLALLVQGQFTKASEQIRQIVLENTTDEGFTRAYGWLTAFENLQAERAERRQKEYQRYVGWVKEETQAAKAAGQGGKLLWKQAIWHCNLALNYTDDREAFRAESWLTEAVNGTIETAKQYEQKGKWLEAASIYARLEDIFPDNKEYSESLKRFREHIRLEFTYAADSDWEDQVKGIVPEMASDAFHKVADYYLKEPVFKEAAIEGLKQLLLLAGKKTLAKVIPTLKDEVAVKEFCIRVEALLEQAKASEEVTVDELEKYFKRVLTINQDTGLLPEAVLVYEFTYGALQPLDRYSDMIWPADVPEFNKHTQGKFFGVGIQIRKALGEPIKVITPLEDTPAYRKGIQPGDLITKINGQPAEKFTITAAVREITGPPGTSVTLTIKRIGEDEEFPVKLTREEITIFTIKGFERDSQGHWKFMIDPQQKIAYVRMTNFTENSLDELKEVLGNLRSSDDQQMQGLIFDLRGNPGGTLKSAVEVADIFLDGEKPIVSTKGRNDTAWPVSSTNSAHFVNFPMIILANEISASASEIVTGALKVHKRALIVGERTFGKGSVQQVLRLNDQDSAFLKLTTALYYLPDGRCLHKDEDSTTWGVDPDVEFKLVPKEALKVISLRVKTDILRGKDQEELTDEYLEKVTEFAPSTNAADEADEEDKIKGKDQDDEEEKDKPEIERDDENAWPEIDPQLEVALLLMRIRLESNQPWPELPQVEMADKKAAG